MMSSNEAAPLGSVSCGARLKQAREAAGLSVEEVSARLKMPVRVIRTLESDDWAPLGAPVFVRGQVRSYARLLNVDVDAWLEQTAPEVAPSTLVSHSHTPRFQRVFEHVTRRAIYIVMTAAIAVPVWLATRPHLNNKVAVQSLEMPATPAPAGNASQPATRTQPEQRTPVIASMASVPTRATQPALSLSFSGESWVQVFAADGSTIEKGLLAPGQQRSYAAGEVGKVVLGNSSAVQVQHAGKPVDLTPFSRANVARFTLSSDGSLAPVAD
jgi:cytoskeleton protein RodZ